MLSIEGLDVAYGESQVLWGVDLDVRAGELGAGLQQDGGGVGVRHLPQPHDLGGEVLYLGP